VDTFDQQRSIHQAARGRDPSDYRDPHTDARGAESEASMRDPDAIALILIAFILIVGATGALAGFQPQSAPTLPRRRRFPLSAKSGTLELQCR